MALGIGEDQLALGARRRNPLPAQILLGPEPRDEPVLFLDAPADKVDLGLRLLDRELLVARVVADEPGRFREHAVARLRDRQRLLLGRDRLSDQLDPGALGFERCLLCRRRCIDQRDLDLLQPKLSFERIEEARILAAVAFERLRDAAIGVLHVPQVADMLGRERVFEQAAERGAHGFELPDRLRAGHDVADGLADAEGQLTRFGLDAPEVGLPARLGDVGAELVSLPLQLIQNPRRRAAAAR